METTKQTMNLYLAGPLFTDAERAWLLAAKGQLQQNGWLVTWPGELLNAREIAAAGSGAPGMIFSACLETLETCEIVVALLDGAQVDDGTAWEIGYAFARGTPVYGVRTDSRHAGETAYSQTNAMIEGCLSGFARSLRELLVQIGEFRTRTSTESTNDKQVHIAAER
jgi:nucleoside 2-deoxyribosyltransferase